ncbi:MAG: carbon-nitrogen hydrolase family protein [Marinibacterium sp.]|nr:carbon-nitrogen hydrolase family protein [Marinibacterium sp.]
MRVGLLQLNSSDDPAANLAVTAGMISEVAQQGATFVLTPEVTNCVSANRARQTDVLRLEDEDETLAALRRRAADLGIWVLIGSLAVKTSDLDERFANRSFLLSPKGDILAWYDKIHMFDVQVSETETYRESAGYRPGTRAVVADTDFARIGMTICYDVRFPHLYRKLAQAGAAILTVPSAFSPVTGAAHWHTLLRARAIETGCYVLAPAQTGTHLASQGRSRNTYGHSLIVAPWGEVVADGGKEPGVIVADLDLSKVQTARSKVPSFSADQMFEGP